MATSPAPSASDSTKIVLIYFNLNRSFNKDPFDIILLALLSNNAPQRLQGAGLPPYAIVFEFFLVKSKPFVTETRTPVVRPHKLKVRVFFRQRVEIIFHHWLPFKTRTYGIVNVYDIRVQISWLGTCL